MWPGCSGYGQMWARIDTSGGFSTYKRDYKGQSEADRHSSRKHQLFKADPRVRSAGPTRGSEEN